MGHETGKRGGEQRVKPRSPRKSGWGARSIPRANPANPQWLKFAPVAKFRTGFISHSGLKIEREISHTFEIRNFLQRNILPAKSPPLYMVSRYLRRRVGDRLATSVCRLRHDQMEQDLEPHTGHSTFLLSSGVQEAGITEWPLVRANCDSEMVSLPDASGMSGGA